MSENVCFGINCITFRDNEASKCIFKAKSTFWLSLHFLLRFIIKRILYCYMNSMKFKRIQWNSVVQCSFHIWISCLRRMFSSVPYQPITTDTASPDAECGKTKNHHSVWISTLWVRSFVVPNLFEPTLASVGVSFSKAILSFRKQSVPPKSGAIPTCGLQTVSNSGLALTFSSCFF